MRILVTGANGFVGRSLVGRIMEEDRDQVVAAVRSDESEGVPASAPRVAVGEINGQTDWARALEGVDCVIHTAARVHMMSETAADAAGAYRRTNTEGTARLAAEAARAGVRRLVFLSTIKVNGDQTQREPFTSSGTPAPEGDYATSKYEAERFLASHDLGPMESVVVRPPLVYGAGVKGNFARMLVWLRRGVPLPLGAVENRRTLVALPNLVDLTLTAAAHPAAGGRVFLAGDAESLSTPELLRRAAKALNTRARLVSVPVPILRVAGDLTGKGPVIQRLCGSLEVDIGEARKVMGWHPPFSVDRGLAEAAAGLDGVDP